MNIEILDGCVRNERLINELVELWEDSVTATHLFLSNSEIENIKKYVPQALKEVSRLVIVEIGNKPVAFMGINNKKLEMLFVKNNERGKGYGKQLLQYGIEKYALNELCVNEQNPKAKEFYEHMGFRTYKKTMLDEQGNPYPILYMKLSK